MNIGTGNRFLRKPRMSLQSEIRNPSLRTPVGAKSEIRSWRDSWLRPSALCAVATLFFAASAPAGSIFDKARHGAKALYTDDVARAIGDTITITITETSHIQNETKRDNDKTADRNANMSGSVKLFNKNDSTSVLYSAPTIDYTSHGDTHLVGDAKFNSDRTLTNQVTVIVQDVLANGNLVILGMRQREIQGDVEVIEISGIVRPSDIAYDNTIGSGKIADFHVVYRHKGQENEVTNPGWLAKLLNTASPY